MDDNSAQGAPRGGFAHAPTGFRRMTPGLLEGRPGSGKFRRPAGGGQIAGAVAGRPEGGGATAWHFATDRARRRLAVPLHPAAGLGAGQPADRMALGLDAGGGARPFADAGQGNQPPPDRARLDHHEGQPERQTLWPPARKDRAYHRGLRLRSCADRDAPRRIRAAGGGGEGGARRHGAAAAAGDDRQEGHYPDPRDGAGIRFRGRGVDHTRPRNSGSRARAEGRGAPGRDGNRGQEPGTQAARGSRAS